MTKNAPMYFTNNDKKQNLPAEAKPDMAYKLLYLCSDV